MTEKTFAQKTKLANAAFRRAAKKVIELAERTGTPVVLWENGKVKKVDPKTLRAKTRRVPKKKPGR